MDLESLSYVVLRERARPVNFFNVAKFGSREKNVNSLKGSVSESAVNSWNKNALINFS
jgi:hypothetical protein